jgi:hypothetical protein
MALAAKSHISGMPHLEPKTSRRQVAGRPFANDELGTQGLTKRYNPALPVESRLG